VAFAVVCVVSLAGCGGTDDAETGDEAHLDAAHDPLHAEAAFRCADWFDRKSTSLVEPKLLYECRSPKVPWQLCVAGGTASGLIHDTPARVVLKSEAGLAETDVDTISAYEKPSVASDDPALSFGIQKTKGGILGSIGLASADVEEFVLLPAQSKLHYDLKQGGNVSNAIDFSCGKTF
jgi:hypothetical protein